MEVQIKKIFGLDLGTAYSSIAYVDENGKPHIIPNSDNQRVTPSVIFFDQGEIIVGDVAKENAKLYPDDVISFVKRAMGEPDFLFEHDGSTYRPEEISSYIIKKVVQDAEQTLGEKITDIVVTCPAYFGINEREATQRAGEIAGYNVRQIINEPTAAAIAYGSIQTDERRVVLVYDLGGGTFDVTLIDITPESIEVVCTGGDHNLGGKDWDDCIVNNMAQEFQKATHTDKDILEDPDTCQDLLLTAEKAKKILGQRKKTPIVITHGGERVKVELTREKFEQLTEALLERTITFTQEMLQKASEKGYDSFDEIILVGGATRMPQVAGRIKEVFSVEPKIFDPDEAVAKGAAIYGSKLAINDELVKRIAEKTGHISDPDASVEDQAKIIASTPLEILKDVTRELADITGYSLPAVENSLITIKDVTSKSFGIVVENPGKKEEVFNLIFKNTAVPIDITKQFFTGAENQETVLIRIMENEVMDQIVALERSTEIGTAILNLPKGLPKESLVQIFFKLNDDGRLKITAVEKTESRMVEVLIDTRSVIQGQELEEAKVRCQSLVVH
ncbi:MAG: Hsp70 family protein [Deltaproteobacteria bacterium]|nr:MAG: Hsp70 family protein [Deltaproteobacteria bacterium]